MEASERASGRAISISRIDTPCPVEVTAATQGMQERRLACCSSAPGKNGRRRARLLDLLPRKEGVPSTVPVLVDRRQIPHELLGFLGLSLSLSSFPCRRLLKF